MYRAEIYAASREDFVTRVDGGYDPSKILDVRGSIDRFMSRISDAKFSPFHAFRTEGNETYYLQGNSADGIFGHYLATKKDGSIELMPFPGENYSRLHVGYLLPGSVSVNFNTFNIPQNGSNTPPKNHLSIGTIGFTPRDVASAVIQVYSAFNHKPTLAQSPMLRMGADLSDLEKLENCILHIGETDDHLIY